jgi:subtilisin-like proprotein convertase family protein
MKKTLMILTAVLMVGACAQATLIPVEYYSSSNPTYGVSGFGGGAINTSPDGIMTTPTSSGVFSTPNAADQVVDLAVTLNISGGYNGDLYAYLIAPNGTILMLAEGGITGLTGSGMNITLVNPNPTGRAAQGVDPTFGGILSSPSGSLASANDSGGSLSGTFTGSFTQYGTMLGNNNPATGAYANGTWNLFVWEQNDSSSSPTLNSWTLDLAVVPEPVDMALGIFAAMMLALAGIKRFWQAHPLAQDDGQSKM